MTHEGARRRTPAAPSAPHVPDDSVRHPKLSALNEEQRARFTALEERVGVTFRHPDLLVEAMTHASWTNERGEPSGPGHDYERLEWLGDAVLELAVSEYLFKRFPEYHEGQMTQLRSSLVNGVSLAQMARNLELGDAMLMGRGAVKQGINEQQSQLCDAYEAMIGAIFLDQGFRVAMRVFLHSMGDVADWSDENWKGRLQEVAQDRIGATPHYRVSPAGGPGHKRMYEADAVVAGDIIGHGSGATKQAAEQAAAHAALDHLSAPQTAAALAASAASHAAKKVAGESARVRRRVVEAAAERGARRGSAPRRRPAAETPTKKQSGLLGKLRAAAEALVGKKEEPPAPEVKKRSRRGHRGGRGRSRPGSGGTPS